MLDWITVRALFFIHDDLYIMQNDLRIILLAQNAITHVILELLFSKHACLNKAKQGIIFISSYLNDH